MATSCKTSSERLTSAERKIVVVRLRREGYSLREIGEHVGLSPQRVHKIITVHLRELNNELKEEIAEFRRLEGIRLDDMHKATWPNAIDGNLLAIDRVLKIMERRAKLFGLDAPTKVAPTNPDGSESYRGTGLAALLSKTDSRTNQ